jgi:hypothetical protein
MSDLHQKSKKRLWENEALLYATLVILLYVIAVMVVIATVGFDRLADWVVAIGTLILAMSTFAAVYNSQKQEERHRQEVNDRKLREYRDTSLHEIISWLQDVRGIGRVDSKYYLETVEKRQNFSDRLIFDVLCDLNNLKDTYKYTQLSAFKIDREFGHMLNEIVGRLASHEKLIDLYFAGKVTRKEALGKNKLILIDLVDTAIEKAVDLLANDVDTLEKTQGLNMLGTPTTTINETIPPNHVSPMIGYRPKYPA